MHNARQMQPYALHRNLVKTRTSGRWCKIPWSRMAQQAAHVASLFENGERKGRVGMAGQLLNPPAESSPGDRFSLWISDPFFLIIICHTSTVCEQGKLHGGSQSSEAHPACRSSHLPHMCSHDKGQWPNKCHCAHISCLLEIDPVM